MKRISLSHWIIIATVIGFFFGWLCPTYAQHVQIVSTIFLHLIKCIVVPLIFSTLVVGIAGHTDDLKAVGRLAFRSIIYFELVTTVALFIGLGMVNLFQPGAGVNLNATSDQAEKLAANKKTAEEVILHIVPESFFDSAAKNDVLQVVVFAILFAVSLAQVKDKSRHTMLAFCESLSEVMFKFTRLVMYFAPFGVGAAVAYTIGMNGISVIGVLLKLVLTVYGALVILVVGVFVPIMLIARIPVIGFFKTVWEPALLAFSTASSEAALPDALRLMERFGVPKRIVAFVLPTGYSFNLDGSTLYLSVAAIFVAQAGRVHLSFNEQLVILLTLMLTSKGVAAVPRASLVILSGTLVTFHLPLEGVAVILAVDAFLDMARTSINLVGNCLASVVMARWEGEFKPNPSLIIE